MTLPCCALGICAGVHPFALSLFRAMAWKLLITELFSQCELNEIETETVLEFGSVVLGVVGKLSRCQI